MSTPSSFWRSSQKLFSKNVLELQTIRTTSRNVKNGKILLNNYQRHAGPGHRVLQTYAIHMKTITWRKYWKYILEQNIKNIWSNYVPQNVKNGIESFLMKMETHPYTMNIINATILGFAGDIICQKAVEKKENIDWNRTARFAFFCGYYQGIICTGVYRLVQKLPILSFFIYFLAGFLVITTYLHCLLMPTEFITLSTTHATSIIICIPKTCTRPRLT